MSKNYIEQEIKVKVNDVNQLIKKLVELGAKNIGTDFQRTIRFDTQNDDLEKKGTFLRVRSGHGEKITMKKKIPGRNNGVFEREEIETTIGDIEKVRQIIKNLGFDQEKIMEKYRSNWTYKKADISIDELPFGMYVEIEANPDIIDEVVKDLALHDSERIIITYWDLLEEFNKKNFREDKDIVFAPAYKSKLM